MKLRFVVKNQTDERTNEDIEALADARRALKNHSYNFSMWSRIMRLILLAGALESSPGTVQNPFHTRSSKHTRLRWDTLYMHYLLCFWFQILFFKQFDYPKQPLTWTEGLALDVMMGCQYACRGRCTKLHFVKFPFGIIHQN